MTLFALFAVVLVVTCLVCGLWMTLAERRYQVRLRRQQRAASVRPESIHVRVLTRFESEL